MDSYPFLWSTEQPFFSYPIKNVGFIFLILGGESVVQGAITLARKMNVSPLLIGFTIIAVGTSLPELAVSLKAVSSNDQNLVDLAVGGVLGSNVANVMLVLGTAAMLGACSEPEIGIKKDAIAVILASLILLITVMMGEISTIIGSMMLISLISVSYTHLTLPTNREV